MPSPRRPRAKPVQPGTTVLLFFQRYERDTFFPYDRYLKRAVRPIYARLRHRPNGSGFERWLELLCAALAGEGFDVRVNDWRAAQANPDYPVGLVGYPELLQSYELPNPAVLGPAMFDHPAQAPDLLRDRRYRRYLLTCDWMMDLFRPVYGDACRMWRAGLDLADWPAAPSAGKDIDVLVYDKVRWQQEQVARDLVEPVMAELGARSLTSTTIRYGHYDMQQYRAALRRSRWMLFLCEHETQGMAYQEALASGLPVLAWDPGTWMDPHRLQHTDEPVRTTSVPHFSDRCGGRFADAAEFRAVLPTFLDRLATFRPREFVTEELSPQRSAADYARTYFDLMARREHPVDRPS